MNARKETKKALETFGKPLTLIFKNKKFRGVGLFDKITKLKKTQTNSLEKVNSFDLIKYNLWVYDYTQIESIDEVVYKNKKFEILTKYYDEKIGCWRLVVQEIEPEQENIINNDDNKNI